MVMMGVVLAFFCWRFSSYLPMLVSFSFLSLFSSYTIHFIFVPFWPKLLVAGLVEVHCCSYSLAARGCHRDWCSDVTTEVCFFCNFNSFVLINIQICNS